MHIGKPAHKKTGIGAHDVMLGLKPGDIMFAAFVILHHAKAHESVHLVAIAAHVLVQFFKPAHFGIGLVFQQSRLRLHPPQQTIHERKPLRIGMQRGILRKA